MSLRLVNLVGTRAVRGDEHAQLLGWYADHVHQLLAFDGLHAAALHRLDKGDAAAPPYLCLYDFTDRAAFDAYERSDVHAQAAQDRLRGWGRDGIDIVVRAQFERLYWSAAGNAPESVRCRVHAIRAARSAATERALAALVIGRATPRHALLRAVSTPSPVAEYLVIEHAPVAEASLPGFKIAWQGDYERLHHWWR